MNSALVIGAGGGVGRRGMKLNVLWPDVHSRKEMPPQIVIEAALIRRRYSDVFIKVEDSSAGEVEFFVAVHTGEVTIEAKGCAAGW